MGVRTMIKRTFRICWRVSFAIFLISLPVTFFPIVAGIEGAWTFHFWNRAQIHHHVQSLQFEAESRGHLNYFNVPGAMGIHDFLDTQGPFHIPKLSSFDWLDKLGVTQPNENLDLAAGVDKTASFDGLVRDASFPEHSVKPTRWWVYVTSGAEWRQTSWNDAFSDLLQQLYVKPLPSDIGILYLDCASASFLCGVWGVKIPSLLHFSVEQESLITRQEKEAESETDEELSWLDGLMEQNYTYNSWEGNLYPVTVRTIELPLDEDQPLLPRSTLPTPALQLRALMLDPHPEDLLEHWDPHRVEIQVLRRFNDLADDLSEKVGTWRYYFNEWDKWYSQTIIHPLFGKEFAGSSGFLAEVQNTVFTIGFLLAEAIHFPFTMAWEVYAWYFGLGWDGEPIENMSIDSEMAIEGGSMMDDMFAGFLDFVKQNLSVEASESAGRAAVTSR